MKHLQNWHHLITSTLLDFIILTLILYNTMKLISQIARAL